MFFAGKSFLKLISIILLPAFGYVVGQVLFKDVAFPKYFLAFLGLVARFDKLAFPLCLLGLAGIMEGKDKDPEWLLNASMAILLLSYMLATIRGARRLYRALKRPPVQKKHPNSDSKTFYSSSAWRRLRLKAFELYGDKCVVPGCNEDATHVDHIYPRSEYPERALDLDNLQIMCSGCNIAKSNDIIVDFRRQSGAA